MSRARSLSLELVARHERSQHYEGVGLLTRAPDAGHADARPLDVCGSLALAETMRGRITLRPGRGHPEFAPEPDAYCGGLASLGLAAASIGTLTAEYRRIVPEWAVPPRSLRIGVVTDTTDRSHLQAVAAVAEALERLRHRCTLLLLPFDVETAKPHLEVLCANDAPDLPSSLWAKLRSAAFVCDVERGLCAALGSTDVVLSPLTPDRTSTDWRNFAHNRFCTAFSAAGWAMIAVPFPSAGVLIAARPGSEATLLYLARDIWMTASLPPARIGVCE